LGRISPHIEGKSGPRWGWGRAILVLACLPLGAIAGIERTQALERTSLRPLFDTTVSGTATVLELARTDRGGRKSVVVKFRGERVLLRPPPWRPRLVGAIGAELTLKGELREPDLVARARHAHATLLGDEIATTDRRRGGLMGVIDDTRTRAQRALTRGLPPPEAGLLRGMVLGEDAALSKDLRDDMRAAGLSHLTAASGANIALLASLAFACCALAGIPVRPRLLIVIALIAIYVPLAGAGPSIQRAGVMGAAGVVALLGSRPGDRWYALLLAASATLALDPRALSDPGWQMSFAAVIALLAWARALARRIPGPRALAEALSVTVLATLATAPVAAAHFGTASLASLPANLLAAPVVTPIMWLGLIAATLGQISQTLAGPFTALCGPPLGFLVAVGEHAAQWPGAGLDVSWVPVAIVSAVGLVVVAVVLRAAPDTLRITARIRVVVALVATVGALLLVAGRATAPAPPPDGTLRVTALDVGQGDAILVQSGSAAVLFDAGVPEAPTVKRLRAAGVDRLDAFVVTHGDADHAGGAPSVLAAVSVKVLVDGSGRLRAPQPTKIIAPRAGQELTVGALRLRILWPTPEALVPGTPPNDLSAVVIASAGDRSALLTGDAESNVLNPLDLPDVDILKVSHHGSADNGLPQLLTRVRPEVALISLGADNTYGHPTRSTLAALRGIETHRTDLEGSISVDASPAGLSVSARK
ncbi:MAG TPA: DNA internalization-related competence protein ComEC/Rec2, partial [Baekduia sp.]|nr:DNA internalization-related competence protein ComEC/Rec2 [Baekduia sp.]